MTNGRCYRRLLFWFFARSMGSEFQRALLIVPASQPPRGVARVKNPGGQVVMWHVVACRRRPAAPSDLPKSWGAAAPPAPPLATPLHVIKGKMNVIRHCTEHSNK